MTKVRTGRAALAGLSASLVGIGFGRFAYTPLIPALIGAHWFSAEAVIYLGAVNLAGYLAGALAARPLAAWQPPAVLLRGMMLLGSAAFFACAAPVSLVWFAVWRCTAGVAGGVIMVLAAPTILPHIDPRRRGLVGGMVFTGIGLGIAASGTLVPLLLHNGLPATWSGLGGLSILLTLLAWGGWPAGPAPTPSERRPTLPTWSAPVRALLLEYGLNAAGAVPHILFLVVFVARGLGLGLTVGSAYWVIYGLGAMSGPLFAGTLADRIGFRPALRFAFAVEAVGVALPAFLTGPGWLALSAAIMGAFTPGVVPLVFGRVHELLPGDIVAQRLVWGRTTMAWALFMAGAGYLYSWLFALTGDYGLLFVLGGCALMVALATDLVTAYSAARAASGSSAT